MRSKGFALEEELDELLRIQTSRREEEGATQVAGLERRQSEPPANSFLVLGNSGHRQSTFTWASGAQGSIFSLPRGASHVTHPPPVALTMEMNDLLPSRLPRARPGTNGREGVSYSLSPPPQPASNDRGFARAHIPRANFEAVIPGGPDVLGQFLAPFPLVDRGQLQGSVTPAAEPRAKWKCRGCFGPVVRWMRGLGKGL